MTHHKTPRSIRALAAFACVFGVLTLFGGGVALFGGPAAEAAAGDVVPVVLWFNFLAGFAYIGAGIGLFRLRRWAVLLAAGIALASGIILAFLTWHILDGRPYEMRTLVAMTVRTVLWGAIAAVSWGWFRRVRTR
ncbi:MAG: hypothetical protein OQK00_09880 [Rhodobacteraceae bacterium]|nr:hypothetical protein [Paracoccaceae bacterium]MCW9042090.1 hypothetical protein [Pseudopelagicola sp.]